MSKFNSKIRILALALSCSVVFGMVAVKVNAANSTTSVISANGITYTIGCETKNNGDKKITIATSDSKDKSIIDIYKDRIEKSDYRYAGKSFFGFGNDKFVKTGTVIKEIDSDLSTTEQAVTAQAISYQSATHINLTINGDYWYCYGSESSKAYLKIGCVNTYQIRTDNLSSAKKSDCKGYSQAILNSNAAWTAAVGTDIGVGLATAIVALIALNITLPETILITVLIAAFGGLGVVFDRLISSYKWCQTAGNYYVQIRAYGTQI